MELKDKATRGALNFLPAATAWWSYEGRHHLLSYLGLPTGLGALVLVLGREIDDWGSLESGLLFLTGLLMTSLFQVFEWGRDAVAAMDGQPDDPHERGRQQRRLEAVERIYRSIVWATLVALSLSVAVIVMNTKSPKDVESASTLETSVVAILGSHLVLILVTIINRIFIVTRSDLKNINDEVQAQRAKRKVAGD